MSNTNTASIHEAQIFGDDADPHPAGWTLRYRDDRGTEHSYAVADSFPSLVGRATVYRGEQKSGSIDFGAGSVTTWRAL